MSVSGSEEKSKTKRTAARFGRDFRITRWENRRGSKDKGEDSVAQLVTRGQKAEGPVEPLDPPARKDTLH